jgi:signal transduction histidine kinase
LFEDPDHCLWIGTWGGGLNRMKNGRITAITTAQGLYDDGVFSILMDNRQNLWMSSNNGVFRARLKDLHDLMDGHIKTISCTAFGEAEGMNSAECNTGQPSGLKTSDGRLWFPTIQGAAVVDPDRIIQNDYPPPVIIENIVVDGKQIQYTQNNEMIFEPGSNRYEFHYTGLSYLAPEKVKFKYQLEGFDNDWIDAGSRRIAYYTNLPYGYYTFRVMACNNCGVWSPSGATISFYKKPYLYQTILFYVFCGLLILGAVLAIYRYRVRQFNKRQKELEELVRMKTRLVESQKTELQDALQNLKTTQMQLVQSAKMSSLGQLVAGMAHEINNPITIINGYLPLLSIHTAQLNQLLTGAEHESKSHAILTDADTILKSCSDAVERIKKIIANLKSFSRLDEADYKLADIHENLESTLSLFLPNYQQHVQVHKQFGLIPPFYCYPGQLNQVFMNLLINAAEAIILRNKKERRETGHILITTEPFVNTADERIVRITIRDDGTGIPAEIRDKIFDPFFTTKAVGSGTGLGLSISYGIIQKHKGSITVSPDESGGTMITVDIPC